MLIPEGAIVSSVTDVRVALVDLMIDLTILHEMAEKQDDRRRTALSDDLLGRLRRYVDRIKSPDIKEKIEDRAQLVAAIEKSHRAFSDSYDLSHAQAAVTHIERLFADVD